MQMTAGWIDKRPRQTHHLQLLLTGEAVEHNAVHVFFQAYSMIKWVCSCTQVRTFAFHGIDSNVKNLLLAIQKANKHSTEAGGTKRRHISQVLFVKGLRGFVLLWQQPPAQAAFCAAATCRMFHCSLHWCSEPVHHAKNWTSAVCASCHQKRPEKLIQTNDLGLYCRHQGQALQHDHSCLSCLPTSAAGHEGTMDKSALEPDWYIGWQTLSAIFALKTSVSASMSPDTKDLFVFIMQIKMHWIRSNHYIYSGFYCFRALIKTGYRPLILCCTHQIALKNVRS